MKILTSHKEGTYVLDQIDLGDYIEAEFVRDLGCVGHTPDFGRGPIPIRGFELVLTLSNSLIPPQSVAFHTISHTLASPLLEGREPGEKLRLRFKRFHNGTCRFQQLVVNGEIMRGDRRVAA